MTLCVAVDKNYTRLCYYLQRTGNFLPKFLDYLSVPPQKLNKHRYWNLQNWSVTINIKTEFFIRNVVWN